MRNTAYVPLPEESGEHSGVYALVESVSIYKDFRFPHIESPFSYRVDLQLSDGSKETFWRKQLDDARKTLLAYGIHPGDILDAFKNITTHAPEL